MRQANSDDDGAARFLIGGELIFSTPERRGRTNSAATTRGSGRTALRQSTEASTMWGKAAAMVSEAAAAGQGFGSSAVAAFNLAMKEATMSTAIRRCDRPLRWGKRKRRPWGEQQSNNQPRRSTSRYGRHHVRRPLKEEHGLHGQYNTSSVRLRYWWTWGSVLGTSSTY